MPVGRVYRFNAIQGTIVATSRFAKRTLEAAFALGQPPITLIDGDRLIDLLIEHAIGVRPPFCSTPRGRGRTPDTCSGPGFLDKWTA